MSSPRLRRLTADYESVRDAFAGHKRVAWQVIGGDPPEAYRVTYKLKGLALGPDGRIIERGHHVATIQLTNEYPRQKPNCVLETPIFHPNFGEYICVGDHWAAGETLADLIVKIGDMIQYRDYNVKSPLNAVAARWAAENGSVLPVGNVDLHQPEPDIVMLTEDSVEPGEGDEDSTKADRRDDSDLDLDIVFNDAADSSASSREEDLEIILE